MATMRTQKKIILEQLSGENWLEYIPEISSQGMKAVPALFSFLLLKPEISHRAAKALGVTTARIFDENPETGKNIIRRYMWHMNEDSGNIGWGIPEAFAETLAASPKLAKEYAHILISYIMDLGHADNFCDHAPLRRSCYWAVGRLAEAHPELVQKSRQWLLKGLEDEDEICRGMATWALSKLPPDLMALPALNHLISENLQDNCEIFENNKLQFFSVTQLAKNCLHKWKCSE